MIDDRSRRDEHETGGSGDIAILVMSLASAFLLAWLVGRSIMPEIHYGVPEGCYHDPKNGTQCDASQ